MVQMVFDREEERVVGGDEGSHHVDPRYLVKYLLRDGLEIGMPAGTRSNHSASLLQYLINLILLLVRGESVAD